MKKAFALLEVLIALIVLSILIISSSKLMLEITKNQKTFQNSSALEVQNTILFIQKQTKFSIHLQISPHSMTFYPLNLPIFFSPNFSPLPHCQDNQLDFGTPLRIEYVYAKKQNQILKVKRQIKEKLEFESNLLCGAFLPLLAQSKIELTSQGELIFNHSILLKGVKNFELNQEGGKIKAKLCTTKCYEFAIQPSEFFYE